MKLAAKKNKMNLKVSVLLLQENLALHVCAFSVSTQLCCAGSEHRLSKAFKVLFGFTFGLIKSPFGHQNTILDTKLAVRFSVHLSNQTIFFNPVYVKHYLITFVFHYKKIKYHK